MFRLMRDFGHEEAARKKRIALVGLRGAGKTTLGSALATELALPFVELDREIEREAGISLSRGVPALRPGGLSPHRAPLPRAHASTRNGEMVMTRRRRHRVRARDLQPAAAQLLHGLVKASPEEHMARVVAQGDLRPMQGNEEAMEDLQAHPRRARAAVPQGRRDARHLRRAPEQSLAKLRQAVAA